MAFGVAGLLALSAHSKAQLFTPGDLVVSTYGSSSTTLADGAPTAITLQEFATAGGAAVLSDTLPTADGFGGSANVGVVGEYGSSSEGNIQLSGDGRYLTIAGYSASAAAAGIGASSNAANGTSFATGTPYSGSTVALAQSTDSDVPRVAILVGANGNVNSSTVFNNLYTTNNPRAVYSANGSSIYISGQGDKKASDQGIFYAATGTNTATNPSAPVTGIYNAKDTRYVTASGGNLYYSLDKSGSPTGIYQVTGLPTGASTSSLITAANNGLSGAARVNYSPEGFFFANSTTLYVADTGVPKAGGTGSGGIQKWTLSNGTWSLQYTLTDPAFVAPNLAASATSGETGFEAITGEVFNGTVDLFAVSYTAGDANPNGLYAISDLLDSTTGAGENFTELESAAGNGGEVFKGVSFAPQDVPEPSAWAAVLTGFGVLGWCVRWRATARRRSPLQSNLTFIP